MKFTLRISAFAVHDIREILARTREQFGSRQHHRYKALIAEALRDIGRQPNSPPARRRAKIGAAVRTFHIARRGRHARHFFLYRVTEDRFVEVARLLHDSMELERHLPPGFGSPE